MFCEKLPFDSLFSSESKVFPVGFLCVSKMYHVRFYIVEKMGFGMAPKGCGIHSKPQPLLQKTCLLHASKTLAMYAGYGPRTWAKGHFYLLFPKIDFYLFKRLYFPF